MIDARALAAAVRAHRGVARLHRGPLGTASTFTADGRVWGIRVGSGSVDVHVVAEPGFPLIDLARTLADLVTAGIAATGDACGVCVHLEDLLVDESVATLVELTGAPSAPAACAVPPEPISRRIE